jgi:hypothetical protein
VTYKWATPYEWFKGYIESMQEDDLKSLVLGFAKAAGNDAIRDEFQLTMESDGYFEDPDAPDPYDEGYQVGFSDADNGFDGLRDNPYGDVDTSVDACDWVLGYQDGWEDAKEEGP